MPARIKKIVNETKMATSKKSNGIKRWIAKPDAPEEHFGIAIERNQATKIVLYRSANK